MENLIQKVDYKDTKPEKDERNRCKDKKSLKNNIENLDKKSLDNKRSNLDEKSLVENNINLDKKSSDENTNNNNVLNLGAETVDEDMETILTKPPRHTVFRKITKNEIEISTEESLTKMRYDDLNKQNKNKGSKTRQK